MDEHELIEKLEKILALRRGATTLGELAAADKAYERVQQRLAAEQRKKPTEWRFTLSDDFSRRLFSALVRHHGLKPYRYARQRYTTVMVRASSDFVDQVLWPEFQALNQTLKTYLDEVTDRVIRQAVHVAAEEAEVTAELPPPGVQD